MNSSAQEQGGEACSADEGVCEDNGCKILDENHDSKMLSSSLPDDVQQAISSEKPVLDVNANSTQLLIPPLNSEQHRNSNSKIYGREKLEKAEHKTTKPVVQHPSHNVQGASSVGMSHSQSRAQIQTLERELNGQKKLMSILNLAALPDGGSKIKSQINDLESAIFKLKLTPDTGAVPKTVGSSSGYNANVKLAQNVAKPSFETHSGAASAVRFYDGTCTTNDRRDLLTKAIEAIHSSLESKPKDGEQMEDPAGLTVPLMPHQRQALAWLVWRESEHPSGGIIADDMGLGKTLTMIALILRNLQMSDKDSVAVGQDAGDVSKGPDCSISATLVVCPASLLHHWEFEVRQRCRPDALRVLLYHGADRHKKKMNTYDVIVTTYEIVRNELVPSKSAKVEWDSPLRRFKFRRIILDEGHVIKNPKSNISQAACALNGQSRWVVTGTPIHNRLTDMYSLLRFLRCSPFDEFKVWKYWVDNKTEHGRQRLATIVSCILLRRTKSQVTDDGKPLVSLPSKTIHNIMLELSKEENEVYSLLFDTSKAMLSRYLEKSRNSQAMTTAAGNPPQASSRKPFLVASITDCVGMARILVQLLRLRQCCCHLSLLREVIDVSKGEPCGGGVDDNYDFGGDDIAAQMQSLCISEPDPLAELLIDKQGKLGVAFERSHTSSKMAALLQKLEEIHETGSNGERSVKSVVVSQWTSMLGIVALHLKEAGMPFCEINGKVRTADRMKAVEEFNDPLSRSRVMLLSLKAGGVGLNLVGGSHLFFMDIHWSAYVPRHILLSLWSTFTENPALEIQAGDRIHRMGQTRDVHIHRFVCSETIEEKIAALQQKKRSLANSVVEGGSAVNHTRLTLKDLQMLFGLK